MLGSVCPAVNCVKNRRGNGFCGKAYCFGVVRNGKGSKGVTKNADRLIEICGVVTICMELPRSADYVDKMALCNAKCLQSGKERVLTTNSYHRAIYGLYRGKLGFV